METVCRLCVSKPQSYVDVYDNEGKSMNLDKKIARCLQIWLYPEDPLPKTICLQCVQKLNDTFMFFETCSKAQATLQMLFGVSSEETRPVKNSSPTSLTLDSAGGGDETTIKMEPGLETHSNLIEDNSKRSLQLPEIHIDLDLKSPNLSEHPEDILECLLENPDNTITASNLQNLCENGNDASGKQKERSQLKEAALTRQSNKERGKTIAIMKNCLKGSIQSEAHFSEESESDENETKNADQDTTAGDWFDEDSATDREASGNKKYKRSDASSKKSIGTKILEDYPWQCVVCDSMVDSLQDLKNHYENVHGQAPVFKCMQCSKVYNRYRSFSRHVKLHHNPKKFSCDICGKSFAQKTVLQSHSAVHSEERPFSCDQCGKRFKQFSSLYVHSKNHLPSSEREKFRCEHCDKEFASKHTLETHRKVHTGERNFICDICGKSFIAKGSLDYHILSHTGDKPHDCSVCGKCFKTARLLAKHVTLHSGIKPHQCDVCGKQFREKGALREHSRIHTGAMPYACDYCGKRFRFKGILTVHTRQHTGERPYACLDCPRQFTNWANYNKHMKRRHRNADGSEQTCPETGRRTYQSDPTAEPGLGQAMPIPTSAAGLLLDVPTYASEGLTAGSGLNLLDNSASSLLMGNHHIQEGKMLSNVSHLGHADIHSNHGAVPSNLLNTAFPCDRLAKDEDDGDDSSDDDEDEVPERQALQALADPIDDHLGEVSDNANNHLPRQLYMQDNSNSSNNSMNVSSAFPSSYSNNSHTKMAVMFQSHHNNKMSSMFYQDNVSDCANQSNSSMGMSSYHMNPYMPSGIASSLASSLPTSLTMGAMGAMGTVGSMGYYLQPLHHSEHGSHNANHNQSHNRISNNQ